MTHDEANAVITLATPELIQKARDLYQTDDVEIDEGAKTSEAEGGTWVAAWVWVPEGEL